MFAVGSGLRRQGPRIPRSAGSAASASDWPRKSRVSSLGRRMAQRSWASSRMAAIRYSDRKNSCSEVWANRKRLSPPTSSRVRKVAVRRSSSR